MIRKPWIFSKLCCNCNALSIFFSEFNFDFDFTFLYIYHQLFIKQLNSSISLLKSSTNSPIHLKLDLLSISAWPLTPQEKNASWLISHDDTCHSTTPGVPVAKEKQIWSTFRRTRSGDFSGLSRRSDLNDSAVLAKWRAKTATLHWKCRLKWHGKFSI